MNRPIGLVNSVWIPLDDMVPFIKEAIIPYHTFKPMVILVLLIIYINNIKMFRRMLVAMFMTYILAYIIYGFFQTYIPRYDTSLLGNDLFSKIVKWTYQIDRPYSGMPSMHVASMTMASIYIHKIDFSKILKWIIIVYMNYISLTTILVKQHVILDIPSGIVLASLFYLLVEYIFDKQGFFQYFRSEKKNNTKIHHNN